MDRSTGEAHEPFPVAIVDDDESQRFSWRTQLESLGFEVAECLSPHEALAYGGWAESKALVCLVDAYDDEVDDPNADYLASAAAVVAMREARPGRAGELRTWTAGSAGPRPLAVLVLSQFAEDVGVGVRMHQARADAILSRRTYRTPGPLAPLLRAPWNARDLSVYQDTAEDRARLADIGFARPWNANGLVRIGGATRGGPDHDLVHGIGPAPRRQSDGREAVARWNAVRGAMRTAGLRTPAQVHDARAKAPTVDVARYVYDLLRGRALRQAMRPALEVPTDAASLRGAVRRMRGTGRT